EAQRGRVTGVWAMFGNFAQAAILPLALLLAKWFPKSPETVFTIQFAVVAALMIGTTLLTCLAVRESSTGALVSHTKRPFEDVREALRGLRTLKQAATAMLVFAISGAGIGAVVPNLSIFVQTITKCSDGEAQMMGFVLMIATV